MIRKFGGVFSYTFLQTLSQYPHFLLTKSRVKVGITVVIHVIHVAVYHSTF